MRDMNVKRNSLTIQQLATFLSMLEK